MKHKTKTKNLEDSTQDASSHAVSHKRDRPHPTEGVRRSTRKRSAPKTFVITSKKSKALYWEAAEKEKLLKVLQELNTQQLGTALYYSKNRYPIKLIAKRIGSKSMDAVKKYLTLLERRGAGMALSQMKHQAPLQSWRQMADKLTALTSDNCSRQLIRVCSILALESKDEDESTVKEHGGDETQTIPTLSLTPATTTTSAASNSTGSNHTNDVSKEIASPDASVSAREIAMTTSNVETVSGSGMSTAASNVANAAAEAKDSSATDSVSSTATSQNISSTSPTRDISSVTTDSTSTSATATSTAAARDSSSTTTATRDSISTTTTATRGNSTNAIRDHYSASASKPNESNELELKPDYPSIYKYFANLMQGEQKELGPLESLIVLDCLTSVEKHLVARDNTKQKKFAQKRFLDILENLYLSIDGETARTAKGGTMNEDTDAGNVLTMADLLGINNQSQSRKCQADQSKATLPENSQSASNYSVSQSTSTMLQGQSSTANKRSSREIPTRLGSLNPFGVPVKLLEIRQDR